MICALTQIKHFDVGCPLATTTQRLSGVMNSRRLIAAAESDVRYTSNSDRESEFPQEVISALPPKSRHMQCKPECPLRAKSRHSSDSNKLAVAPRLGVAKDKFLVGSSPGNQHDAFMFAIAALRNWSSGGPGHASSRPILDHGNA